MLASFVEKAGQIFSSANSLVEPMSDPSFGMLHRHV